MKNDLMRIYSVIGNIQRTISKTNSLDEALGEGLKTLQKAFECDYLVAWYANDEGILRPYYWLGDLDFSAKKHTSDDGVVGEVYKTGKTIRVFEYKKGMHPTVDEDFSDVAIQTMICVPMSVGTDNVGCIQLVNKTGSSFSEEEADIFEILANMIAIAIEDNDAIEAKWKYKDIIISARDVKKTFKNGDLVTKVLNGVNLDVYEGEFLVILGESGCGKSTFLNIIGGMDTLTEGSFSFMGHDLSHASQEELTKYRRDNIGFIFQSYNLMPNLTAAQNIDLIAELVEKPLDTKEVLELVGLTERANNYPSMMSGGQQQRVSIARALVKNPKLIFADEPTAALDYTTSIEVLSALENVVNTGTTLVMVTHNEEITKMADRVIKLRGGRLYETIINKHPVHATDLVW
ncbi:MAG: ATP-binding cassette domain-containing protein [Lachnospiraceae bacterium]|nr:ATP-binding cassette domain-containing protein [Lachnospiraceae bacterium]